MYEVLSNESHHYSLQQYITPIFIVTASHKFSIYIHNTAYQTYRQTCCTQCPRLGTRLTSATTVTYRYSQKRTVTVLLFNTTLFFNTERSHHHYLKRHHQNHILYTFCSQLLFSVQRSSETPAIHYFGQQVHLQVLIQ